MLNQTKQLALFECKQYSDNNNSLWSSKRHNPW